MLANLRSAVAVGAAALNYARVDAIVKESGVATGVEARCELTGRRVRVRGRCVINAAGPWVEPVRRLECADAAPLLHLSKGVHVVVRASRLPVNNMLILNTRDRRSVFVIRQGEVVYIGTTDTTYTRGHEHWPEITREDVEYLLEPTWRYLTCDPLTPDDVIAAWAGLRPLIAEPGKQPHEISRRDEVLVGPARVVTMAGGKLTGYRPMARETVERAAALSELRLAPAPEREEPLPGGDFDGRLAPLADALVRESGVGAACAQRMVRLYGTEAAQVAALGAEPLDPDGSSLCGEVDWAVRFEGAATVEDVMYRRTRSALFAPDSCAASLERVAGRMAELLGWDAERTRRDVDAVRARLSADLAFR